MESVYLIWPGLDCLIVHSGNLPGSAFANCAPTVPIDIRMIRDDLFDSCGRTDTDFDTPAYQQTRRMLNGLLRSRASSVRFRLSLSDSCRNDHAPPCAVQSTAR